MYLVWYVSTGNDTGIRYPAKPKAILNYFEVYTGSYQYRVNSLGYFFCYQKESLVHIIVYANPYRMHQRNSYFYCIILARLSLLDVASIHYHELMNHPTHTHTTLVIMLLNPISTTTQKEDDVYIHYSCLCMPK